jgi:hypothetical protein
MLPYKTGEDRAVKCHIAKTVDQIVMEDKSGPEKCGNTSEYKKKAQNGIHLLKRNN